MLLLGSKGEQMGFVIQYYVYSFEEKNTKLLFLPFTANRYSERE